MNNTAKRRFDYICIADAIELNHEFITRPHISNITGAPDNVVMTLDIGDVISAAFTEQSFDNATISEPNELVIQCVNGTFYSITPLFSRNFK